MLANLGFNPLSAMKYIRRALENAVAAKAGKITLATGARQVGRPLPTTLRANVRTLPVWVI